MDKLDVLLCISLAALFIMIGWLGNELFNNMHDDRNKMLGIDDNVNCTNLSFLETTNCLKNQVSKFYKYNLSNVGKELTLEELKTEGGVCGQWSNYYIDNMKALGFKGEEIDFYSEDNKKGHAVALVYDKNITAYCILDQLERGCVMMKEDKNEAL